MIPSHPLGNTRRYALATVSVLILGGCATRNIEPEAHIRAKFEQPQRCLALSGGGLRSASISLGLMQELYRSKIYDDFDIVSAASGGSWALLWVNARAAHDSGGLAAAFGTGQADTDALRKVDSHTFVNEIWTGWTAFWSFVLRGIGAHAALYGPIKNKFGASLFRETSTEKLHENVAVRKHPVPIFTTTRTQRCFDLAGTKPRKLSEVPLAQRLEFFRPLKESVVELTPYGWGNSQFWERYVLGGPFGDAETWATISGAAPDHPYARECNTLTALGASFGKQVRMQKEAMWLTDGGFADNIAAYPLIRRQCSEIVILDAEHDPTLEFEAYQRLRHDLAKSESIDFRVPAIDAWLKRRSTNLILGRDFLADDQDNEIVARPVARGTARSGEKEMTIIYAKLTLNPSPEAFAQYDPEVQRHYKKSKVAKTLRVPGPDGEFEDKPCPRGEHTQCSFPHVPTFDTSYREEEFRAHRRLGSDIARLYLIPMLSRR